MFKKVIFQFVNVAILHDITVVRAP